MRVCYRMLLRSLYNYSHSFRGRTLVFLFVIRLRSIGCVWRAIQPISGHVRQNPKIKCSAHLPKCHRCSGHREKGERHSHHVPRSESFLSKLWRRTFSTQKAQRELPKRQARGNPLAYIFLQPKSIGFRNSKCRKRMKMPSASIRGKGLLSESESATSINVWNIRLRSTWCTECEKTNQWYASSNLSTLCLEDCSLLLIKFHCLRSWPFFS